LTIINSLQALPDLDFLLSPGEREYLNVSVPVFSRHRLRGTPGLYLLLPQEWQLRFEQMHKFRGLIDTLGETWKWEDRSPALRWRGTNSNCPVPCDMKAAAQHRVPWTHCLEEFEGSEGDCRLQDFSTWMQTPRGLLVFLSQYIQGLDAKFTGTSQPIAPELWNFFVELNLTEQRSDTAQYWEDAVSAKFTIDMMGHADGDRKYLQLLTGSTVLIHTNPFTSWLVGGDGDEGRAALQPFVHFVPVSFDLSDLAERIEWLRNHDEEAWQIAETGRLFASRELTYDAVLLYIDRLLRGYAAHVQP